MKVPEPLDFDILDYTCPVCKEQRIDIKWRKLPYFKDYRSCLPCYVKKVLNIQRGRK